jgi:hypothetical protein
MEEQMTRREKRKARAVAEEQEDIVVEPSVTKERKQRKSKKEDASVTDNFQKDLDDFLMTSAGVDVKSLRDHEQVPFWINSGSYALNWIISDDMFAGIPATKICLVSGEQACLDGDTKITIQIPEEYAKLFKK